MTEEYLQFVWKNKRILNPQLKLIDGTQVEILNFGSHNTLLKGPDFKHGSIRFDGITFYGHIEIHVKSSDWYVHKHHIDDNYNNVILHVVYENDKDVFQNGVKLPVIELKDLIDMDHWNKHKRYLESSNQIICENELNSVDPIFLQSMIGKSLVEKLNDRVKLIKPYLTEESSALYVFLAAAFGSNLNKHAFLELIKSVPYSQLVYLTPSQRYKLMMSESGMLTNNSSGKNEPNQWHFKGTRPNNFPTVRLKQFAHLIGESELELLVKAGSANNVIEAFNNVFERSNDSISSGGIAKLSSNFKNGLIINGVVPFLWYLSEPNCEDKYQEMAIEILTSISPESNSVLKKWKNSGVNMENAYDSQGLIGLYRYYCCRKKCLSCQVGNKILKN
ncbi:MAG: DUF2851 family protein [Crocinitomicaceae bacterium]|nr:DUF2851 family protein [Crocinitomicaceae bacterium]